MSQLFHAQFGVVARSKGGDARKMSAYQKCVRVERRDGRAYDFRRKADEHTDHEMMLPNDAPAWAADPAQLWQRSEDSERRGDAQTARLVEIALPRAVPAAQRLDFVRTIAQPWIDGGMCAQVDIHCMTAADGQAQPHAHIMLTMRRLDADGPHGLAAKKERAWNADFTANQGRDMRSAIAGRMNAFMSRHGINAQVDSRTHAAQGIASPAPERDVSRRAWQAHRADSTSSASEPVRATLSARPQRAAARRDVIWETARAAYAEAAAAHYEGERARRHADTAARTAAERAARDGLRTRYQAAAARARTGTPRGLVRDLARASLHRAQTRQTAALDTGAQAARMTTAAPGAPMPSYDQWIEERAAAGDPTATAALAQRADRRAWLARTDPAAAARRTVDDIARAADRVLRGRPRGSVDDQALFVTARNRLTERRDTAAEAARITRQAVWDHRRAASWWTRLTDTGWRTEHARMTATAATARADAARIGGRHDRDVRTARTAAGLAAAAHRRTLAAWLDRPDVRAAQTATETAERVQTAIGAGDTATIRAAATGDLPSAAQAAREAAERQAAEDRRRREQQQAEAMEARRAAEASARDTAWRATAVRQSAQTREMAKASQPTPGPGLRMR